MTTARLRYGRPAASAVLAVLLVSGCATSGRPSERRCESAVSDAPAPASYCAKGVPGYEWEPGPPNAGTSAPADGSGVGSPAPAPDRHNSRTTRSRMK